MATVMMTSISARASSPLDDTDMHTDRYSTDRLNFNSTIDKSFAHYDAF